MSDCVKCCREIPAASGDTCYYCDRIAELEAEVSLKDKTIHVLADMLMNRRTSMDAWATSKTLIKQATAKAKED